MLVDAEPTTLLDYLNDRRCVKPKSILWFYKRNNSIVVNMTSE